MSLINRSDTLASCHITEVLTSWQAKEALEQNDLIAASRVVESQHDLHFLGKNIFP